jgi:hypothetical protein
MRMCSVICGPRSCCVTLVSGTSSRATEKVVVIFGDTYSHDQSVGTCHTVLQSRCRSKGEGVNSGNPGRVSVDDQSLCLVDESTIVDSIACFPAKLPGLLRYVSLISFLPTYISNPRRYFFPFLLPSPFWATRASF